MKIEYAVSSIGIGVEMIIPVVEYEKASNDQTQFELLQFAIDTFTSSQGAYLEFGKGQYNAIKTLLPKSGNLVFVIRESETRRYKPPRWCEIYLVNDSRLQVILYSDDDGENLYLCRPKGE